MRFAPSTIKVVTSADGTSIFAEAAGDPHVVLTAGPTLSASVYDEFVQLLDLLYIVRYDIRGHGRRGNPTDAASYQSETFAEDFQPAVDEFKLNRPMYAGWSMGSVIVYCPPPSSISLRCHIISGAIVTGELAGELFSTELVEEIHGLFDPTDVNGWRHSAAIPTEKLFANPDAAPWSVKMMYMGNSLSPEITTLSLTRPMDPQKLRDAGKDGLPGIVAQGLSHGHRAGAPKTVEDVLRLFCQLQVEVA